MSTPTPQQSHTAQIAAKKGELGAMVIAAGTLITIVGLVMIVVSLLGGVIADGTIAPLAGGAADLPESVVIARTWSALGTVVTFFGLLTLVVGYLRQISHRLATLR